MHPDYAADVPIAGAVMGGIPPNITKTYHSVNGGESSGLSVWAILGMMNAYPELQEYMDCGVLPEFRDAFYGPMTRCTPRDIQPPDLAFANVSAFFDTGDSFLERFRHILDTVGVVGQYGIPDFPMFVYHGTNDDIAPTIQDIDDLVERFCKNGTRVTYHRYMGLDHTGALVAGMAPAWAWISSIFRGFVPRACSIEDVPTWPGPPDAWERCAPDACSDEYVV